LAGRKKNKIIKYRKPGNLNVGVVIFAFIFVYMMICVGVYFSKETVHIYEVSTGSLTSYADYSALILRNETTETTDTAGYINYYVRNGRKVGVGDLVCSIDETGQTLELLTSTTGENQLSTSDLKAFKSDAMEFVLSYDSMDFSSVYDMKSSLQSSLLEYVNASTMEELSGQLSSDTVGFVKKYAAASGIFSSVMDGLESVTPAEVTSDMFDTDAYSRTSMGNGTVVAAGTPIYRRVENEEWYLIFQITEEDRERFANADTLTLSFKGTDLETSGQFEMYAGADGNIYGKITLKRYMIQFIDKRYVNIEIATNNISGLKIPVSSVVEKLYYKVPMEYRNEDGDVLVETYGTDGTVTVEKIDSIVYSSDNDFCYVDGNDVSAGQYIIREDSTDRYQLALTAMVKGVYNVNKGYTIFRKVEIINESEEYYIISKSGSAVSQYDHIVLNGDSVVEGQIIYY
jgi:hypothetical protein